MQGPSSLKGCLPFRRQRRGTDVQDEHDRNEERSGWNPPRIREEGVVRSPAVLRPFLRISVVRESRALGSCFSVGSVPMGRSLRSDRIPNAERTRVGGAMLLKHGCRATRERRDSKVVSIPSCSNVRARRKILERCARTGNASVARGVEDVILRSISDNGEVSVLVADTTDLVQEAARRHGTSPTATSALGRLLTGAVLMGAFKAEGDAVQITFRGTGDIRQMTVIAESNGLVKGTISNPLVDPPPLPSGQLNVSEAIGSGVVTVVRSHPGQKRPYSGVTPIHSGEIAEDLAHYLSESEQVQSAIGLGVTLGEGGRVVASGGWLVQVLPFASDETISALEQNIYRMPSPNELHARNDTVEKITEQLLEGIGVSPGAFHLKPKYGPCELDNLKLRMKRAVALLGKEDIENLIEEQNGVIEVTCEFCKDVVRFGGDEILKTLEEMSA